jgi:DNA-binding winged helix-turn-helix (wHTH) protein
MSEDAQVRKGLRFGVFELDVRAGELRKNGLRVRLQEQPIRVLTMLVEHPGEVVTREELQKRVWPADTYVDFDHGLNKAINKIRDALADSAESPRFVETVPRRGYRFLAEVKAVDGAGVSAAGGASQPAAPASGATATADPADHDRAGNRGETNRAARRFRWAIPLLALVVVIGAFAIWKFRAVSQSSPVIRSLAVLPLESLSSEASQDYFADGMTDELISDLGQISALRVISRPR